MKYLTLIYEQQGGIESMLEHEHADLIKKHVALQANSQERGVYAGLLEKMGKCSAANKAFERAIDLCQNDAEKRFMKLKVQQLAN